MPPSNSSFIDDLSPREKRYDLEIDPNLFISVLPNGAKTWVLCDIVLGKPRRKTLGVYPEMSLSEARDAVERVASVGEHPNPLAVPEGKAAPAESRKRARVSASPSHKVRDGRIVPAKRSSWPLIVGGAAGILVLIGAAVFWFGGSSDPVITQTEAPRPATAQPSPTPPPVSEAAPDSGEAAMADATPPSAVSELPNTDLADEPPAAEEAAPVLAAADAPAEVNTSAPEVPAPVEDTPAEATVAVVEAPPPAQDESTEPAVTQPVEAPPVTEPAPADIEASAPITAEAAPEIVTPEPPAAETGDVVDPAPPATEPAADAELALADAAETQDASQPTVVNASETPSDESSAMTAGASQEIPQTPAPSRGVARYQLTSAIRAREPTDDLANAVSGGGADVTRVYFFTDLRGLTGETVTHRWFYNDAVSATVNFNVGGWRWRTYSSKDLLLGQGGEWRIEVVDEAGETLASHTFTFTP